MAGEDPDYTDRVARLSCCARGLGTPCQGEVQVHHRSTGRNRVAVKGADRRAHDHDSMPLCMGHHVPEWHGSTGFCKGWSRDQRTTWEDEQVARTRKRLGLKTQGDSDGHDRPDADATAG